MPEYIEAEFRGTDNVWVAEVTEDSSEAYTAGTPVNLAPTGQISKTVNSSSETHYYSNIGMITIVTKGSDTVTITVPVLTLAKLGLLTGQTVDPTTGALITGELKEKYFAVMYRVQLTDNSWRYVTKYKCQLSQPPEEVSQTRSDGVNTNNQQLVFTCNKTIHEFENGGEDDGHADGIELDERDNMCDFSTFFTTVYTPDTIQQIATASVTAIALSDSTLSLTVGDDPTALTATTTPTGKRVSWRTSNANVATVDSEGNVTAVSAGTAVITAVSGTQSAACTVTVTAS